MRDGLLVAGEQDLKEVQWEGEALSKLKVPELKERLKVRKRKRE
jgi:hypothetical protein